MGGLQRPDRDLLILPASLVEAMSLPQEIRAVGPVRLLDHMQQPINDVDLWTHYRGTSAIRVWNRLLCHRL